MATTLPTSFDFEKPSLQAQQVEPRIKYQTFKQHLLNLVHFHQHTFSWPVTLRSMSYPAGQNSHQTCTQCGTRRFFNTEVWEAGRLFHW